MVQYTSQQSHSQLLRATAKEANSDSVIPATPKFWTAAALRLQLEAIARASALVVAQQPAIVFILQSEPAMRCSKTHGSVP